MAKTLPFDRHPDRYDDWFERYRAAYESELAVLRALLPSEGEGMEVGVGTGRFAGPLGLRHGVDPSPAMRERARRRGIEVKDLLIRRAQSLEQRLGLQRVFYAHLKANIENLEPSHLADLAIESARAEAGRRREDGISYLITVKENGISTPLLDPYERAILAKAGASSLGEAREMLVNGNR